MRLLMLIVTLTALSGCRRDGGDSNTGGAESSSTQPRGFVYWKPTEGVREYATRAWIKDTEISLNLGNTATMKLVLIPGGSIIMGSPTDERGRSPNEDMQREPNLCPPFYMGAFEVTRGQFAAFAAEMGYQTYAEKRGYDFTWDGNTLNGKVLGASWKKPGFEQTDEHPVVLVSQYDASAFCDWVSRKTGTTVTLPTEAQWEHACRAGDVLDPRIPRSHLPPDLAAWGTRTAYPWGDDPGHGKGWLNAADQAATKVWFGTAVTFGREWQMPAPWDDGHAFTAPVGTFRGNRWGLFDMVGNVAEWCAGHYSFPYGKSSDPRIGDGVIRGGSWRSNERGVRCASRSRHGLDLGAIDVGFRVVAPVK